MNVTDAPLPAAVAAAAGSAPGAPSTLQQRNAPAAQPAPPGDRVDIKAPDTAAALRMVILDVLTALELATASPDAPPGQWTASTQATTAELASRVLVEMFLRALPEGNDAAAAMASRLVQATFQTAIDRSVEAITAWPNIPAAVADAVRDTRALVISQFRDLPMDPRWLRPEWLDLVPRMQRFWRRRRSVRRGITDPDMRPPEAQDDGGGASAASGVDVDEFGG
jgi:hypothetical protein